MKIGKILNNNVVVVYGEKNSEKIIIGCGIAFQKRVGDNVDEGKIDKVFSLVNPNTNSRLQQLLCDIPMEYVELTEKIIDYTREKYQKKLNEYIYITLIDHIYMAVQRAKDGIFTKNIMLWDIKKFYKDEFQIGLHALSLIEEDFGVKLIEDEAGYINNMMTFGFDNVMMPFFACTFTTSGVVLAIFFKTKDKKLKELALPNFISGIFGVTEPAIYGILLPLKKPFIISCIVGGIVGGYYEHFNFRKFMVGGMGIFEFPAMIAPDGSMENLVIAIIGAVMALVLGFIITFVIYKEKIEEVSSDEVQNSQDKTDFKNPDKALLNKEEILSPLSGKIIPLKDTKDEAFASGALGRGLVIIPSEGVAYSPVNGTLSTIFPTLHALGITSDDGTEILIHIGINTVQLGGKYFKSNVEEGDRVSVGQPLVTFDIKAIEEAGFSIETPVLITSDPDEYFDLIETEKKDITSGETIFSVLHLNK